MAEGYTACVRDPSGKLGHVLKYQESNVAGGQAAWFPHQPGLSWAVQVCPMEELAGSRCPGVQGRMCRAPSSLGAAHGIIMRQHERPTGPLPAHQPFAAPATLWLLLNLFGWSTLPPEAPSFSTLFRHINGRTESPRNNKQPHIPKLAVLEAWGLPNTGWAAWLSEAWGVQQSQLRARFCL